jgi:hypothetical protein
MKTIKTKGDESINAIFLQHGLTHDSHVDCGLTKREYFASQAMQAILSTVKTENLKFTLQSIIPMLAVKYADMLIEELNKGEQ